MLDKYDSIQIKSRAWKTQLNIKFKENASKFPTDFEKILYACTVYILEKEFSIGQNPISIVNLDISSRILQNFIRGLRIS